MELTPTYILSQVCTIIMYALLGITYQVKSKKKILILSLIANSFHGVAYILINAKSGLAMCILAILRDLSTMFISDRIKDEKKSKKIYLSIIVIFFIGLIISAIYTYEGILSMLSIIATAIYSYSIWQKNEKIYKALGTPASICWLIYDLFVKSIFGVIFDGIIFVCSVVGYVRSRENKKININNQTQEKSNSIVLNNAQ